MHYISMNTIPVLDTSSECSAVSSDGHLTLRELLKTGWCLHFSQTHLHIQRNVLQQSPALCKSSPKCLSFEFSFPSNQNSPDEDAGFYQTFPAEHHPGRHASASGFKSASAFHTDSRALTSWFFFFVCFPLLKLYVWKTKLPCRPKKPHNLWPDVRNVTRRGLLWPLGYSHFSYNLSVIHEWCMLQKTKWKNPTTIKTWASWILI